MLLALVGIIFMQGVCAGADRAPDAPVSTSVGANSMVADPAGDHQHDHDSCHMVADIDDGFLVGAVFLLLLTLYPMRYAGAATRITLPGRVMRTLRHEAVGRVPRLALCVIRV